MLMIGIELGSSVGKFDIPSSTSHKLTASAETYCIPTYQFLLISITGNWYVMIQYGSVDAVIVYVYTSTNGLQEIIYC